MYPLDGCDSLRVAVGFVPFRCTTGFCPGTTEGSVFYADATGLLSNVLESSTLESEPKRLEINVKVLAYSPGYPSKESRFSTELRRCVTFPIDRGGVCFHHCCGTR